MKKLFLFLLCVLCSVGTWADTTYTLSLNGSAVQSTAGYFTVVDGGGYNKKYTGTYDGVAYSKGLKINSNSSISFTTKGKSTVLIVQSTAANGTKEFKFDDTAVANSSAVENPNSGDVTVKVYTLTDVEVGNHSITNSGETGLLYVSVTEASATNPTISTMPQSATYAVGNGDAEPLTVGVDKVNSSDVLEYQWYSNSTNSAEGGEAITGATEATYTPDISVVGTTYYYCVITEKDGEDKQVGNSAVTDVVKIEVIDNVETPIFTVNNGTVQIDCATESATVYYSVDNQATWKEYTTPFTVLDEDTEVWAKGVVATLTSEIVSLEVEAVKAQEGSSSIILSYDTTNNFDLGANTDGQSDAALIGKEGTDYAGWEIQVTGTGKSIGYGNAIGDYTTVKGSNGRQVKIVMPDGVKANRITIYSYINTTTVSTSNSYWKEVAGVSYDANSIAMASYSDAQNPDVRVYALDNIENTLTMNNAGNQLCFYAVIDYTVSDAASLTLNSEGFATYSGDHNVVVSGAQVYTCTLEENGTIIDAQPVESNTVPAYNGVLLYGEPGATVELTNTSDADALADNDLKSTTTADGLQTLENALVLNGSVFKTYTGSAFIAGKAYLPVGDASAKSIAVRFADIEEGTGISLLEDEKQTETNVRKVIMDGQLLMQTADGIYTVTGARMK